MVYGGFFGLVMLAFWLWALYDAITAPAGGVRNLPKVAWVFIVLLFFALGAFAWVALGRPARVVGSAGAGGAGGRRWVGGDAPSTLGGRLESDPERRERERRDYYRRMDEELDRRLEEKQGEEGDPA